MKTASNGFVLLSALGMTACVCVNSLAASAEAGADRQASETTRVPTTVKLEEIVVTGSRLKSAGIDGPVPVTVFNREKLDQLGATTLSQVLQYVPEQPYMLAQHSSSTGAQFAEIRGLGVGSTLVLINGRRVVASAASTSFNGFDLNTIPLSAVERIEVLSESASAVYGADAVGGVINVVLKKVISSPVIDLRYGAADGGGEEKRASFGAGYSGDRLTASVILDYFDKAPLLGSARERLRNQDFRRYGGDDWRLPNTNPGNIRSWTGGNLPGLPASFAAVPVGSSGIGMTPADFLGTAGVRNLDSIYRYDGISPAIRRASIAVFSELQIAENLEGFADLLYVDRDSDYQSLPSRLSGALVPATNAFNPFGEPVLADYMFTGIGPRHSVGESRFVRATAGLRGTLGRWDWEVSLLRSEEDASSEQRNSVDMARAMAALASSDPESALNVFQDGPGGTPQLLESLVANPDRSEYSSNATLANAFVRGSLFELPAGPVDVVIGAEWNQEDVLIKDQRQLIDHGRQVGTGYFEFRVPLLAGIEARSDTGAVQLTLAGRYDDYSDFGGTFNPQMGITWRPVPSVLLRAGYGHGFRAPSLYELYSPRKLLTQEVNDPRRNGESVSVQAFAGGNPDLDPIEAKFASAGIVWEPRIGGDPRLSVDFWRIQMDQRVSIFSQWLLLANEPLFPERVRRSEPTPADVALGLPGKLIGIDVSRINYGELNTHGIDLKLQTSWQTPYGRLMPTIAATWVGRYQTIDVPNTPRSNRVGLAGGPLGTVTRWRAVGTLAWSNGSLGLSAAVRHTPSYEDRSPFTMQKIGRTVRAQTLVDLRGSIDLGERNDSWLKGFKLSAGIINLFDQAPPFAGIGLLLGYDTSQGDLRQRFFYAQLSKKF